MSVKPAPVHGTFDVAALLKDPALAEAIFNRANNVDTGPAKPGTAGYFVDITTAIDNAKLQAKGGPLTALYITSLRGSGPIIDLALRPNADFPPDAVVKAAKSVLENLGFDLKGVVFQTRVAS